MAARDPGAAFLTGSGTAAASQGPMRLQPWRCPQLLQGWLRFQPWKRLSIVVGAVMAGSEVASTSQPQEPSSWDGRGHSDLLPPGPSDSSSFVSREASPMLGVLGNFPHQTTDMLQASQVQQQIWLVQKLHCLFLPMRVWGRALAQDWRTGANVANECRIWPCRGNSASHVPAR